MSDQYRAVVGRELESLRLADMRIEMEVGSGQVPWVDKSLSDKNESEEAEPNTRDAGISPQSEMGRLRKPARWYPWKSTYEYPMVQGDPWETLKGGVDRFDKEMCSAWNGELDTILTFTGLFSAAVTAFCIESFQFLSQSPADTTNIFLVALSQQLSNSSSPVANFSQVENFTPSTQAVYINVLYFTSLALALSVSSACILGKQWIREYQKDISASAQDAIRVRQARFDSFETWKVPQILASLPVILLSALLLFFTGLLIQIWNSSNHTTAIVVSVVVACTTSMVIITTIVPALCSMQPCKTAFTPFRSPQAWIIFVAHRRLKQWYGAIFHTYFEAPKTLASWAAFDRRFLMVEAEDWFEHEVSSVHRALQWAHEVLGSSSLIEKSIYWCFQECFHPSALIKSAGNLSRHVLSGSKVDSDNPYHLCYNYSRRSDGWPDIDSPVGRSQVELLIRSAYYAMSTLENPWDEIRYCCQKLSNCGIYSHYLERNIVHHQHIIQDQIALLLERTFDIPPCLDSFDWTPIIRLLLRARSESSSPVSCQILEQVVPRQIPEWVRKQKSVPSLLHNIGDSIRLCAETSWEHAIELFTHLDSVMVDMCNRLEETNGSNESVQRWRDLRRRFIFDSIGEGEQLSSD